MARISAGLTLCLGLFILLGRFATPGLDSWHGRKPQQVAVNLAVRPRLAGFLPLEVAQIQREADYTKDQNSYLPHTTGLIAMGLGLGTILIWRFGLELAQKLRGDPLPKTVRGRLDRLEPIRMSIIALVRIGSAKAPNLDVSEEKAAYEELSIATDHVLDKIRQDLRLNFVDEEALVPALDALIDQGQSLLIRLRRLASASMAREDARRIFPAGSGGFDRINRGWERVLAGKNAKLTTIQQLYAMRWPPWPSLLSTPA
jgi:hypothetical protein